MESSLVLFLKAEHTHALQSPNLTVKYRAKGDSGACKTGHVYKNSHSGPTIEKSGNNQNVHQWKNGVLNATKDCTAIRKLCGRSLAT